MTPLAQAIRAVDSGQSQPTDFYRLFLKTELLVPVDDATMERSQSGELGAEDDISILVLEGDDGPTVPLFDAPAKLNEWAGQEMPFMALTGEVLLEVLDADLQIALNPNSSPSKLIDIDEIAALRAWLAQSPEFSQAQDGPVRVTAVTDLDPELDSTLKDALRRQETVKRAYLLAAVGEGEEEDDAHLLIMLDSDGSEDAFREAAGAVGRAIQPYFDEEEYFELMRFEAGDSVSDAVRAGEIAPYFTR
jgi:hypothetical protein